MDVSIMIEGQMGLDWPRWRALAAVVERLGFAGLYRSDHFVNASPPDDSSLEMVTSMTYLASSSSRLRFGPLVAPVSYRHPVMLARQAAALGALSDGRFVLGLGAGWNAREHEMFGYELLDVRDRMTRLREGLEVATRLLRSDGPEDFDGRFYRLRAAAITPKPPVPVSVLVGGNGPRYTLPLAAQYADVWNGLFVDPAGFAERCAALDDLLRANGRAPGDLRRTLMTGIYTGDAATLDERLGRTRAGAGGTPASDVVESLRARGALAGTFDELPEQARALEAAGCQEVMLQWLWLDDLDGLASLAEALV